MDKEGDIYKCGCGMMKSAAPIPLGAVRLGNVLVGAGGGAAAGAIGGGEGQRGEGALIGGAVGGLGGAFGPKLVMKSLGAKGATQAQRAANKLQALAENPVAVHGKKFVHGQHQRAFQAQQMANIAKSEGGKQLGRAGVRNLLGMSATLPVAGLTAHALTPSKEVTASALDDLKKALPLIDDVVDNQHGRTEGKAKKAGYILGPGGFYYMHPGPTTAEVAGHTPRPMGSAVASTGLGALAGGLIGAAGKVPKAGKGALIGAGAGLALSPALHMLRQGAQRSAQRRLVDTYTAEAKARAAANREMGKAGSADVNPITEVLADPGLQKVAKDMPSFTKQDRPKKVKEIYRALKRDHPEMPAEMKARIAARQGKKGKQHQGPPYKGPLTKTKESAADKQKEALLGGGIAGYLAQGDPESTPRSGFWRGVGGGLLGGAAGTIPGVLAKSLPLRIAGGIAGELGGGYLAGRTARATPLELEQYHQRKAQAARGTTKTGAAPLKKEALLGTAAGTLAGYLAGGEHREASPRSGTLRGLGGGVLGSAAGSIPGILAGNMPLAVLGGLAGGTTGGYLAGRTARPTPLEMEQYLERLDAEDKAARRMAKKAGVEKSDAELILEKIALVSAAELARLGKRRLPTRMGSSGTFWGKAGKTKRVGPAADFAKQVKSPEPEYARIMREFREKGAAAKLAAAEDSMGSIELNPEDMREAAEEAALREDIEGRGRRWGIGSGVAGGVLGTGAGAGIGRLLQSRLGPWGYAAAPLLGGLGAAAGSRIGSAHGAEEALHDKLVSMLRQRQAEQAGFESGVGAAGGGDMGDGYPFDQGR